MMRKFKIRMNDKEYVLEVEEITGQEVSQENRVVDPAGRQNSVSKKSTVSRSTRTGNNKVKSDKSGKSGDNYKVNKTQGKNEITAPMAGKILEIRVKPGQKVKKGEVLIVLEAMKLENNVIASRAGEVKDIIVEVDNNVEANDVLAIME